MLDDGLALDTRHPSPVTLRRLTTADAEAFARHVAQDSDRLLTYLPWPEATGTPEGAAEWLGPYERNEDGRVVAAGAWSDGGELLGGALLFHHDPTFALVELGCWVVEAGEGHGIAAAACRAMLDIARDELDAERVEWRTTTVNERSRALAERLGFKYEGTLRSNYVLGGERYDTDVLSLVGDEISTTAAPANRP
jgi:ribosomal-protein-serine acetyltransferase